MKIEDRLSDAMHEYADRIEPDAGSWARIASRFDESPTPSPRPTRGPLVLAGVALALIVALITTLVIRDNGDNGARVVTQPDGGAAAMPSRILAVTTDGAPVVLQSSNSRRLIDFGQAAPVSAREIATSPDGTEAYVVRGRGPQCAGNSILRLPVGVGVHVGEQIAADATQPTVSPDGHYLAYLHCVEAADRTDEIVLRDLTTGTERVTPAPAGLLYTQVSFAPDSRHVLLQLDHGTGKVSFSELDLLDGDTAPGRNIPIDSAIYSVGYLGTTGELVGIDARQEPSRVVAVSAETGLATRTLFTSATLPERPGHVASDASGRHVLVTDGEALYRWSAGDDRPTAVVGAYLSAAWIPDAAPARPPVAPTAAPNGVLVAKRGGEMVVLGAQDAGQHSSLGTFPDVSSVSTTADGRQVFFAATGQSGACGNPGPYPDLSRLIPATGAITRIVGGALSPAVSPDGKLVAYGIWCEGRGLGFTNLLTGENSRSDALGSTADEGSDRVETAEPLGWSPDSTELLYRLGLRGDPDPHYYVGRLWPAVPQSRTRVIELPSGPNVTGAAFLDNDTVAIAVADADGSRIQETSIAVAGATLPDGFGPAPQHADLEQGTGLFEVPGRVTSLVADSSGQHFLALNQAGDLYRWSRGEDQPTKVGSDVAAATWLPWS